MTIAQLQQEFLASNKERIASEDFFILLAHATKKEKVFLLAHPKYGLAAADEVLARDYFRRRLRHEPIAYIVGHKEFYGYDFLVTKDTLIPRPETELVVEQALDRIRNGEKNTHILDIGTGSGNIIIAIAKEIEKKYQVSLRRQASGGQAGIRYQATDISERALHIAKQNAKWYNVDNIIEFHEGNLFAPLNKEIFSANKIIITANLPYLSHALYGETAPGVRDFEPRGALISDQGGLSHYYRLLESVRSFYTQKQSLTLFLEISPEQTLLFQSFIQSLFPNAQIQIHKDLAQKDRVVEVCLQ
ncbi:MAG: peptide chain release factor N(5)-glutamine methyltransferase [bacterium]|nr:peptide chain release factor N(5)-glutamine methyltransferase [bacterium]